jgi:hypothetical protein
MKQLHFSFVLVLVLASGCSSLNKPSGASFASVVIANHSPAEIRQVTSDVFMSAGYHSRVSAGGNLVYEREGTRKQQIAHGGWLDDHSITERVRAEIVSLPDGTQRLQCKAFIVEDAGDTRFESEKRLANIRSGPYQRLLDEVASKLK